MDRIAIMPACNFSCGKNIISALCCAFLPSNLQCSVHW